MLIRGFKSKSKSKQPFKKKGGNRNLYSCDFPILKELSSLRNPYKCVDIVGVTGDESQSVFFPSPL